MRFCSVGSGRIASLVCSPDGTRLAAMTSPGARLWLWDRGCEAPLLVREGQFPGPVAFSPRGDLLASGRDRQICLCDLRNRQERFFVNRTGHYSSCLAFTPDGRTLISAGIEMRDHSQAASILLGEVATGQERKLSVPFPAVSRPRSGTTDGSLVLWEQPPVRGGAARLTLWHIPAQMKVCQIQLAVLPDAVAFSPCRNHLALGAGDVILLWRLDTLLSHLEAELSGPPWSALTLPLRRKRILARMPSLGPPRVLAGHTGEVESLAFSPEGATLFSGGRDQTIRRWDVTSDRECDVWDWGIGVVGSLAVAADGMTAVAGGDEGQIVLWDLDS